MTPPKPTLTIIAGPNGAGKSTFTRATQEVLRVPVNLIYVGVDNVQTSIERVAQRVTAGGHNVPEADILRRYERSLANLPVALQQADSISIFDNSTREGYRKVLTIENGRVTEQATELPEWIKTSLPQEVIGQNCDRER